MAKEQILRDKDGNEIYPITGSQQVFRNGTAETVEQALQKLENKEAGVPEAPSDGKTYGRNNGAWKEVQSGSANAVLYTEQNLTDEQQAQARTNILSLGQQDSTVYDIVHLTWTSNAATTRKLIPAGNRKKGLKISYKNASSVYIVEQYQSEDVSDTAWGTDANWKGCRTPLTPLFESLPEVYFNDETGFYEVWLVDDSGLDDVTEEDMMEIYNSSLVILSTMSSTNYRLSYKSPRAIIPVFKEESIFTTSLFRACSSDTVEYFRISVHDSITTSTMGYFGDTSRKLRKVGNIIDVSKATNFLSIFIASSNLNYVKLKGIKANINFAGAGGGSFIKYECVKYWIDNAANTSAITITVHPTTYSYLTGTAEPTAEVGGTTEEWQALVTAASEKQISFATA